MCGLCAYGLWRVACTIWPVMPVAAASGGWRVARGVWLLATASGPLFDFCPVASSLQALASMVNLEVRRFSAKVLANLGSIYYGARMLEPARAHLRKALAIEESLARAHPEGAHHARTCARMHACARVVEPRTQGHL